MAKLSAHGTEIARLVRTRTEAAPDLYAELYGITEQRYEYHFSFRSDGHIMRRIVGLDTHPNESDPKYRRADFGWKLYKKLQDPKRDTVRRMKTVAHEWSVKAEQAGTLKEFKMTGGPFA